MPEAAAEPVSTKSVEFDDTVIISDKPSCDAGRAWVGPLLSSLVEGRPAAAPVVSLSLADWERAFAKAVKALDLVALRATPHCLRHGSASTDFALGLRTLDAIQRKGRWKASASVRRYEKSGRLSAQVSRIPAHILRASRIAVDTLPALLSARQGPARRSRH